MTLLQKLVEIRKALPYLKKDKQGYNYRYVSPENLLGAVQPLLNEHGILVVTESSGMVVDIRSEPYTDRNEKSGKTVHGISVLYSVHDTMRFTFTDVNNPEDKLVIRFPSGGTDDQDLSKAIGKMLTYAERYLFLKLNNIPTDEDDPDNWAQKRKRRKVIPADSPVHPGEIDWGKPKAEDIRAMIHSLPTVAAVDKWEKDNYIDISTLPESWQRAIQKHLQTRKAMLTNG